MKRFMKIIREKIMFKVLDGATAPKKFIQVGIQQSKSASKPATAY